MKLILGAWSQTSKQVGDPVSGNFISFFVRSWISTLPISNQSMSASKYSSDIFESAHILGPVDPTENQLVEYWIKSAIFEKPEWTWTPVLSSLSRHHWRVSRLKSDSFYNCLTQKGDKRQYQPVSISAVRWSSACWHTDRSNPQIIGFFGSNIFGNNNFVFNCPWFPLSPKMSGEV